jgi:predicted nuclease of restriction endonuclease-like (RecB) superfamily
VPVLSLGQLPAIGQTLSAELTPAIRQTVSAELQPLANKNVTPLTALAARVPSSDLPWRNTAFILRLIQGLTWSHLIELSRLDSPLKRAFYEVQTLKEGWRVRDLRRQVNSLLFERVGLSKDQDLVMDWARTGNLPQTPEVMIRDPYILEFTGLKPSHSWHEQDLEQALIDHLHDFLLELGTGFCFVARQYRITIANKHHHLDLLFYHRHLRCLVAIDLKIGTFDHSDAGQMNLYLNFLRENATRPDENPPVGLLLCAGKDEEEVHYATTGLDQKLFVSRYLVELPSEERLRLWLHQEQEVLTRIAAKHEAEKSK